MQEWYMWYLAGYFGIGFIVAVLILRADRWADGSDAVVNGLLMWPLTVLAVFFELIRTRIHK
jgi:hypothetical protein